MVEIYTKPLCGYCFAAKNLLRQHGIEYREISLQGQAEQMQALSSRSGRRTVPQIFRDGEFIGGFDELNRMHAEGSLASVLAPADEQE